MRIKPIQLGISSLGWSQENVNFKPMGCSTHQTGMNCGHLLTVISYHHIEKDDINRLKVLVRNELYAL